MKTPHKMLTLGLVGWLSACQTLDPYTGEAKTSNATTGAVIGAVGGAIVGAAASSKKDRGKGALIGAALITVLKQWLQAPKTVIAVYSANDVYLEPSPGWIQG